VIFFLQGFIAELNAPRPGGLSIVGKHAFDHTPLLTLYDLGAELQANAGLDL
jgi:hypothetical protein